MNLPQITFDQQSSRTRGLRLQTLVWLRWIAVIGQTAAVLFIYLVLGFPLPLGFCLAVIALSAWLNIFLALPLAVDPAAARTMRRRFSWLMTSFSLPPCSI